MRSAQKHVQQLLVGCASAPAVTTAPGTCPTLGAYLHLNQHASSQGGTHTFSIVNKRFCFISHEPSGALPAAGSSTLSHHGGCPACSSISHQRAHMVANSLSQPRHFSQTPLTSGPATPAQQHSFSLHAPQPPHIPPHVPPPPALKSSVRSQSSALLPMDETMWLGRVATQAPLAQTPASVHKLWHQVNIFGPAYIRGWTQNITWGMPSLVLTSSFVAAELLLLPSLAPGGASVGTLVVEGLAQGARVPTDLASLLAASEGLEAVQAFSFSRKLAQAALLWTALQAVTGQQLPRLLGMQLANPMDKARGWYRWACLGLLGLAAVNLLGQGCSMALSLLPESLGTMTSEAFLSPVQGDERTLPFRCRWWVDTCLVVPLLEEVVFRGFLLTSLTRFMPVWAALLTSSSAFAACHLGHASVFDLPQLVGMGLVLGMVFVRSRNLLAPVLAHSINNTTALLAEHM